MSNQPQLQAHATWQSSAVPYLRASKLSEYLRQPLCGCTSAQTNFWVVATGQESCPESIQGSTLPLHKPAFAALCCSGWRSGAWFCYFNTCHHIGKGYKCTGGQDNCLNWPWQMKKPGSNRLQCIEGKWPLLPMGRVSWGHKHGMGKTALLEKTSRGWNPAQKNCESPVLRDCKSKQLPQAGHSSNLLYQFGHAMQNIIKKNWTVTKEEQQLQLTI